MPKRKSTSCPGVNGAAQPSVACFDAALDLLACDTFSRLDQIKRCFEDRAGIEFEDGVVKCRWEEAVNRYWVMKGMDDLCCSMGGGGGGYSTREEGANGVESGMRDRGSVGREVKMDEDGKSDMDGMAESETASKYPNTPIHPGAIATHSLCADEAAEWRRWTPKVGDLVLVHLELEQTSMPGLWPGRIIDKRTLFQGRSVPRGSHFFPVRIYHEAIAPTVTIKSRLLPLHMRPDPPLLASEALQSAYHHAAHPDAFDLAALARETQAAHQRTHPGVTATTATPGAAGAGAAAAESGDIDGAAIRRKRDKEQWNVLVNWVMNERRIEKLRTLDEERGKRLRNIAKCQSAGDDSREDAADAHAKKRRTLPPTANGDSATRSPFLDKVSGGDERGGIFRVPWGRGGTPNSTFPTAAMTNSSTASMFGSGANTPTSATIPTPTPTPAPTPTSTPTPTATRNTVAFTGAIPVPSLASFIRPALSTPQRPLSPRRLAEKKRNGAYTYAYSGVGEYSPRGRGHTYTPPRILPSGDETAPQLQRSSGSPAPSRNNFDFVSPLGPVRLGRLSTPNGTSPAPNGTTTSVNGDLSGSMAGHVSSAAAAPAATEDGIEGSDDMDALGPGIGGPRLTGSLEAVKEEEAEAEAEAEGKSAGWIVVSGKRGKRLESELRSGGEVADGMDVNE